MSEIERMDLNQAYNYLLAQGYTIAGDGNRYKVAYEGTTVQASLQQIIAIAEECKKQEQVAS